MLRQRQQQVQIFVRIIDVLVCGVAFFIAYLLRNSAYFSKLGGIAPIEGIAWILAASITIHIIIYPYLGFYDSLRLKSVKDILSMTTKALIIEFFVMGSLVFLLQEKQTSRAFFTLFIFINFLLINFEKLSIRAFLTMIRMRGYNFRHIYFAGMGRAAEKMITTLKKNKHWGYVPMGVFYTEDTEPATKTVLDVPVVGPFKGFRSYTQGKIIDELYFTDPKLDLQKFQEEMEQCEAMGIPIRIPLSSFVIQQSKVSLEYFDGAPVLTYYRSSHTPIQAVLKRALDILISLVGLLITVILYPVIAYKIKSESPGAPVLFKQMRIGENGRKFKCYKFRTMNPNADDIKNQLAQKNEHNGPIFKIKDDPRVFNFGAFLRATSLDELPQFFNILRGDMSVVGTRPPTLDEVELYKTHHKRRLSIKPGLTGLWQISGRNEIKNFDDILKLDLEYIDQWSLFLDFKIILKTIWVVLFRRGAY